MDSVRPSERLRGRRDASHAQCRNTLKVSSRGVLPSSHAPVGRHHGMDIGSASVRGIAGDVHSSVRGISFLIRVRTRKTTSFFLRWNDNFTVPRHSVQRLSNHGMLSVRSISSSPENVRASEPRSLLRRDDTIALTLYSALHDCHDDVLRTLGWRTRQATPAAHRGRSR